MTLIEQAKISKPDLGKTHLEDLYYIDEVLSGNKKAFAGLYKKYYPHILQKMMTGTELNIELSKDLTMDVMLKMYENLGKYELKATFSAWISSMAKNTLLNYFTSQKYDKRDFRLTQSLDVMFNLENEEGEVMNFGLKDASAANPEELYISKESSVSVRNLLSKMDEVKRKAIEYIEFEDMKYDEAAEKLGVGLSNFKVILLRAKQELKGLVLAAGGNRGV